MPNNLITFRELPKDAKNVCLLHGGTKSILAWNPKAKFKGNKLKDFKKFAKKHKNCKLIGFFSYDIGYEIHNIKPKAVDDLKIPKIYFLAFDKWIEQKPIKSKLKTSSFTGKNFKPIITEHQYTKAYKKIKHYIFEGDIYQINLTHRLEATTPAHPRDLFLRIIEKNPVEFLAYIEGDGFEVLSASPERFVKIKDKKIETCPIKGTRPRGEAPKQDAKFKKELLQSEKEAAELNMITDLLRNDTGKVSEIGSVKVRGNRLISKCPTVWHTYSRITGKVAPGTDSLEALISMLPGGSITGCPKKRAIEIIDELEKTTRSVYTGIIGHIDGGENLDFSIAIRTIIKKNDKLYLQVGGGIVLDSKEKAEYKETLDKAKSFMNIIRPPGGPPQSA